jgi:class 3 adenylate cyclase/tetratricopeptide (TPR) repeat protein
MVTCATCGQESPDGFRFCGNCGSALLTDAGAGQAVRKTITVLFCDLVGSTALGERLDPESTQRVLGQYFQRVREVLERHQGTVEKYVGDAVVGVFGVPRLHEDDALRAVRAAAELGEALSELNKELERGSGVTLKIRVGLNTGEVVAGSAAAGSALVLGDAVNVAARLEQAAAPGEVLLGQTTWQLVRDAVRMEAVAPLLVKGRSREVAAWRLLAVTPDAPGRMRRRDLPIVGRKRERQLLLDVFDLVVAARACRLVTVFGAAGVGKTRLVEEALVSMRERAAVLHGRCLPYGEGITYYPVAEVVRQAAGIARDDALPVAHGKLVAALAGHEQAEGIASRLAATAGLAGTSGGTEEVFWAVRKFLEHLASRRPLVVAFDDLHWAEPTLLDLVEYVASFKRDAPMLLLGIARTEFLDARPAWGRNVPGTTSIELEPLSSAESDRLVEHLLGTAGIDRHAKAHIAVRAGGNPLFVEELVAKLLDDGVLHREGDRWIASPQLDVAGIPATIQVLLAARLEQLPTSERAMLERASVIGTIFSWAEVAALTPEPERVRLSSGLAWLVRRDLLRPGRSDLAGGDAFRFRHDLIRDAAYQAVPKQVRAGLHERLAAWLESTTSGHLGDSEEMVAYHLERAASYRRELGMEDPALTRRAALRLAAAGQRAGDRWDRSAAISFLTRARGLLPAAHPDGLELAAMLVANLGLQGDQRTARELLAESLSLARQLGDRRLEARLLVEQQLMVWSGAAAWPTDEARAELDRITALFEEAGDQRGLASAWLLVAKYEMVALRYRAAETPIRQAVRYSRAVGDDDRVRLALQQLGTALVYGPTPVPRAIRRCRQLVRQSGDSQSMHVLVNDWRACLEAMQADFPAAEALLEEAAAILADLGPAVGWAPWTQHHDSVGLVASLQGDLARAEEAYQANCQALEEAQATAVLATELAYLANTVYEQGRHDEAGRLTEASERLTTREDDLLSQLLWRCVRAKVMARLGLKQQAEQLSRQAVALAEQAEAPNDLADAWATRAMVLGMTGRGDQAVEAMDHAIREYTDKGNVAAADLACGRLHGVLG